MDIDDITDMMNTLPTPSRQEEPPTMPATPRAPPTGPEQRDVGSRHGSRATEPTERVHHYGRTYIDQATGVPAGVSGAQPQGVNIGQQQPNVGASNNLPEYTDPDDDEVIDLEDMPGPPPSQQIYQDTAAAAAAARAAIGENVPADYLSTNRLAAVQNEELRRRWGQPGPSAPVEDIAAALTNEGRAATQGTQNGRGGGILNTVFPDEDNQDSDYVPPTRAGTQNGRGRGRRPTGRRGTRVIGSEDEQIPGPSDRPAPIRRQTIPAADDVDSDDNSRGSAGRTSDDYDSTDARVIDDTEMDVDPASRLTTRDIWRSAQPPDIPESAFARNRTINLRERPMLPSEHDELQEMEEVLRATDHENLTQEQSERRALAAAVVSRLRPRADAEARAQAPRAARAPAAPPAAAAAARASPAAAAPPARARNDGSIPAHRPETHAPVAPPQSRVAPTQTGNAPQHDAEDLEYRRQQLTKSARRSSPFAPAPNSDAVSPAPVAAATPAPTNNVVPEAVAPVVAPAALRNNAPMRRIVPEAVLPAAPVRRIVPEAVLPAALVRRIVPEAVAPPPRPGVARRIHRDRVVNNARTILNARDAEERRHRNLQRDWREVNTEGRTEQLRPADNPRHFRASDLRPGEPLATRRHGLETGADSEMIPQRPRFRQAILHRNPDLEYLVDAIVEAVMATPTFDEYEGDDGPF